MLNITRPAVAVSISLALGSLHSISEAQGFYYELETVASTGGLTDADETIQSIRSTSVNESGVVAFGAAVLSEGFNMQGIYILGADGIPAPVGPASDARNVSSVSITSDGKITALEQWTSGSPRPSAVRVWDTADPATTPPPLILNTGAGVDTILSPVSRANDGTVLFPAFPPRALYFNTTGTANQKTNVGSLAPGGQAWVASGGAYVLREGTGNSGTLSLRTAASGRRVLATAGSAEWGDIGSLPGISDSGKVVAFAGGPSFTDQGIFLWIEEPGNPDLTEPIRIAGFKDARDGLGYDDAGEPVIFDQFELTQRVGVQHREAGSPGIEGDEILIAFIAKPKTTSFTNPHTGFPMMFSDQFGLWVVHLTPSRDLTGTQPVRFDVKTSPMPVLQVGDVVDGQVVTRIFTHDPLAFAEKLADGTTRVTLGPADHYLGFEIETVGGTRKVMRAAQFDSDFDGFFDHWEKPGGGLDVNRDGVVDLALDQFGADPMRKDAFFEIDWSAPWRPAPGVVSVMEPPAPALQHLVDRFAAAPVPNPVGPPGITVHIDAGLTRSINMPATATLSGGDEMVDPGGAGVVTLIYSNDREYQPAPEGTVDPFGLPYVERSAKVLRDRYFGKLESNARELVFRHVLIGHTIAETTIADFIGLGEAPQFATRPMDAAESFEDLDGDGEWFEGDPFIDLNGNGTYDPGEPFHDVRGGEGYDPAEPFTDANGNGYLDRERPESSRSMPGNSILIGLQGRYDSARGDVSVYLPLAGKPLRVPTPPALFLISSLYHEVGHTLGLLHGGSDDWTGAALPTPKPQYRSVMNYRYGPYPDHDGAFILDYSSTDIGGSFNDWAIARLDFARYFDVLGDQTMSDRMVLEGEPPHHGPRLTLKDLESAFGEAGLPLPPRIDPIRSSAPADPDRTDADGDGLVWLLELALGLDPDVADARDKLRVEVDRSVSPPVTHFVHPRDTSRGDLEFVAEFSSDLKSWSSTGLAETVLGSENGIETVRVKLPEPGPDGRGFIRLRASRK